MSTLNARGGWTNLAGNAGGNVLFNDEVPPSSLNEIRSVRIPLHLLFFEHSA